MRIMLSGSSGLIFVIWIFVTLISVIASAKKKNLTKNGSWPNNQRPSQNPGNRPNMPWPLQNANTPEFKPNSDTMSGGSVPMQRVQWDNAKIRQQMSQFQGNSASEPQPVLKSKKDGFTDSYPEEESYQREEEFQRRSDVFIQPMPMERVEEYVPEEFGEVGSTAEDNFYSSTVIQSSLHDEGDIAREKAYQSKHKEAFKQQQQKARKQSRFSRVLARGNSMKKAILLSEILTEPKALKERL